MNHWTFTKRDKRTNAIHGKELVDQVNNQNLSITKMWTLVKFIEVIHSPSGIKHKTTTSSNALHMMAMKFFSYIKKTKVPQVKCITSLPPKNAISCIVLYHPCKNNMTLLFQPISIYCLIENCSSFLSFVNWCEISFSLDAF